MKNLIKATIDIYKTQQVIRDKDLDHLMWSHPEFGLLKVTSSKEPGRVIPWEALPGEVRNLLGRLTGIKELGGSKSNILKSIGDIYNLNRMTENFADGSSRKMTSFEMVHKYENALNRIRYAGYHESSLEALSEGLLKFLGNNSYTNKISCELASGTWTPGVQNTAIYDFNDVANPTYFIVYLLDTSGNFATGDFTWQATGV